MPMPNARIKLENAYLVIKRKVANIEKKFYASHVRFPSLISDQDYVLLGEFIERDHKEERDGGVTGYDLGSFLIRKFLERENFFASCGKNRRNFFDGFMGRVYYAPASREYEFRASKLRRLEGTPFPQDYPCCMEVVNTIYETALRMGHQARYGRLHKLEDWITNPASELLMRKDYANYSSFIKYWREMVSWQVSRGEKGVHYL